MLDIKHSISNLFPASLADLKSGRRLLVLFPPFDINLSAFAQRVWELAKATGSSIQFLGLVNEANEESKIRRNLTTVASMVKDENIFVETQISFEKSWLDAVRMNLRASDTVVCFAEHRVSFSNKPLSQILESQLHTEIYILSGFAPSQEEKSNWIPQTLAWIGSLAIIFGFFFLQVRIIDLTREGVRTLFLLISLPIGIGLLWAWNSLFG